MKRIFIAMGISALLSTGCNSSDTKTADDKDRKAADAKSATPEIAASITDVSGSKDAKTLLAQNWESKEDAQEAELSGGGGDLEMPYRGISLFSDLTAVKDPRDNIRFGKWELDDSATHIILSFTDGTKVKYKIVKLSAKTLILGSDTEKKTIELKADGKVQKTLTDEPFYGTNNQWRIKPSKTESDEEVKKRVLDIVSFYNKLLKDEVAKGSTSVPTLFVGLPSVFNWFDGAITVVGKEKITPKWNNCFYNKEQAIKAQQILENVITKKYKWDKKEPNWVKKDGDVVQQIYDTLSAAK